MSVLKAMITPACVISVCFAAGMIFLLMNRNKTLAKVFLGMGFCFFFFLSFRPTANFLMWNLEKRYAPISDVSEMQSCKYIVVLTAWDSNNFTVPYTSNLGYRSALRTMEAVRLYELMPHCKIIISGSSAGTDLMSRLMMMLGISEERIIIDYAENTLESALNIGKLVCTDEFILVTSAIHLPRAMKCFIGEGLRAIPGPADFSYGYYQRYEWSLSRGLLYYMPDSWSFWKASLAVHEYIGISWYYMIGLLSSERFIWGVKERTEVP